MQHDDSLGEDDSREQQHNDTTDNTSEPYVQADDPESEHEVLVVETVEAPNPQHDEAFPSAKKYTGSAKVTCQIFHV